MMRRLSPKILTIALAFVMLGAPFSPAIAQSNSPPPGKDDSNEAGDNNEFGNLKVPYQLMMNGRELLVEARIVLREMYTDQDATYFMFGVDTQESPALYAEFTSLETASGEEIPVLEKQGTNSDLEKWFVDIRDMPPVGTEIVLKYKVGATQKGFFQSGAMIVPFDKYWEQITMSDGEQAKLYGATQIGVNKETEEGGGMKFRNPVSDGEESRLPIPGAGALVAVSALAAVGLALGTRERGNRRP